MINAETARKQTDKVNKDGRIIELEEKHEGIFKYINSKLNESIECGEYEVDAFLLLESETARKHIEEVERVLTHHNYEVSTKTVHLKKPLKGKISYNINISWDIL